MGHIKDIQQTKGFISVKEIGNPVYMFVTLKGGTGSYGKIFFIINFQLCDRLCQETSV